MAGVMLSARARARQVARRARREAGTMAKTQVSLKVNGQTVEALVEPRTLLIHFLRENLSLTGPHIGCDTSHCGACTVDLDGKSVKSCTVFAVQADGAEVITIEGIAAPDGTLHALQEGFREMHGLQCGFCTPGMITRAYRLLQENPNPTEDGDPPRHLRQYLPLHRLPEHRQGHSIRRREARRRAFPGGRGMNDVPPSPPTERAEKLQGLGCKRRRVEDARFIQGKGNYVDDLKLPGMLYGDFVRSPYAHARVKKIDASQGQGAARRARRADRGRPEAARPPLHADARRRRSGGARRGQGPLPEPGGRLRHRRRTATSPADAVELVEVDYEELPVIVDPFKSMAPDAPVLREDIKDKTDGAHGKRKHHNHIFTWEMGDQRSHRRGLRQGRGRRSRS